MYASHTDIHLGTTDLNRSDWTEKITRIFLSTCQKKNTVHRIYTLATDCRLPGNDEGFDSVDVPERGTSDWEASVLPLPYADATVSTNWRYFHDKHHRRLSHKQGVSSVNTILLHNSRIRKSRCGSPITKTSSALSTGLQSHFPCLGICSWLLTGCYSSATKTHQRGPISHVVIEHMTLKQIVL